MFNPMAAPQASKLEGLSRSEALRASPRMFESDLLDKVSRVHPAVPVMLFGPAIVVLFIEGLIRGAGWAMPLWLLGGYVFWTLTEYWMHRAIFHFEPEKGIGARLHWIIHGVHHDHPNDPMRLVMPPSVSVPLSSLFVLAFYAVFGLPGFLPFSAGFLVGYLVVHNINTLHSWLGTALHVQVWHPEVYAFDTIPNTLEPYRVAWILGGDPLRF